MLKISLLPCNKSDFNPKIDRSYYTNLQLEKDLMRRMHAKEYKVRFCIDCDYIVCVHSIGRRFCYESMLSEICQGISKDRY